MLTYLDSQCLNAHLYSTRRRHVECFACSVHSFCLYFYTKPGSLRLQMKWSNIIENSECDIVWLHAPIQKKDRGMKSSLVMDRTDNWRERQMNVKRV